MIADTSNSTESKLQDDNSTELDHPDISTELDNSQNSTELHSEVSSTATSLPISSPSNAEIVAEHAFSALVAAQESKKTAGNWFLDSCCSRHMTKDASLFHSIQPLKTQISVKFGDGFRLQAQGHGLVVTPLGSLDALYVPKMCANLLSVHHLNQAGAGVFFLPEKSEIRYQGQRFSVSVVGSIFQVDEVGCHYSQDNELDIWHQKLGHLNYPAVVSFLKRFGIKCNKPRSSFCRVCAKAKISEHRFISRKGELGSGGRIHSDIGGPIDKSLEGFKYWITFLHDKSSFSSLFVLLQVLESQCFVQMVEESSSHSQCWTSSKMLE
jgi:hypothetical protein